MGRVWLSQKLNRIPYRNYFLFSTVAGAVEENASIEKRFCFYIGILGRWIKICLPQIVVKSLTQCNGRGIALGSRCICFPSSKGKFCSENIKTFVPLCPPGGCKGGWRGQVGILEAVLIGQAAAYVAGLLFSARGLGRVRESFFFRAVWALVHPIHSRGVLCFSKNLFVFWTNGQALHRAVGETEFRAFLFLFYVYCVGLHVLLPSSRSGMSNTNFAIKALLVMRSVRLEDIPLVFELVKIVCMQGIVEFLLSSDGGFYTRESVLTLAGVFGYVRYEQHFLRRDKRN
ncbi:MAG: uncharacterized protein A8A55_1804 [Amphiamblys sp. WSBS2006]|nr:MAG: uncharacterized protein A8A55_1804 [Amphiamblys sp. WSBS2006]